MVPQNAVKVLYGLLTMAVVAGMTAGCKRKSPPLNTDLASSAPMEMETTTGEAQPNLDLERLLFEPASKYGLQTVYFDFDSAALRPDAMETLRQNAEKIRQVPGIVIQLAGHCDERGTQEYNLALGERRALAVRNYLIQLGVSGNRLVTISYGKELPAVDGHNEAAWAKNRRVEFNRAVAQ